MDTWDNLLSKSPLCWRPFLRVLTTHQSDIKILEHFLPRRLHLQTVNVMRPTITNIPDWYGLLQSLSEKEPVLREGNIHFSPRFALLSCHCQRTILKFLEKHKEELPINMLKSFLQVIREAGLADDWCRLYCHLLNMHSMSKTFSSCHFKSGFISAKSSDLFENICRQIQSDSKKHSFVNCQPQCSWLANAAANGNEANEGWGKGSDVLNSEEQVSQKFKRKTDDSDISDSIIPSWKKQRVDLSAEDIFPEMGAVVDNEEVSLVSSEIQVKSEDKCEGAPEESVWGETHKLTYGPLQDALHTQKVLWTAELTELLKTFVTLPVIEVEVGCTIMNIQSLSLPSLVAFCHQVTSLPLNYVSFTTSKLLAKCLFISKISSLKQTAPRNLQAAISQFGKTFSKPLIEGCLIPFLHQEDLGPHQTDLLVKVSKDCLEDAERVSLLRGLLQKEKLKWSEHVTTFVQGILNTKVSLESEALDEVVGALGEHASTQKKCPKFAKLVLAVINKFKKELTSRHKIGLQSVIEKNETFLKNAMNVALKKCMV